LYSKLDKPQPKTQNASDKNLKVEFALDITYLFRSVKSAVPGRALRLSAAPPTTIVIADPGPAFRIFEHEALLTLQTPSARRMSR
jgi:hypothetical protein